MKRYIGLWQLMGFAITSLSGTILHFLYEWLGEAIWVAPFSAVNESTWEHMKLLFWPMFIFAIIQSFFFREQKSFWCVKLRGIVLGLALVPVLFYTLNGVFGSYPDWVNIAIFFVAGAIAYIHEWRLFNKESKRKGQCRLALIILFIIALLFIVFTFNPPEIPLFLDPISKLYGLNI